MSNGKWTPPPKMEWWEVPVGLVLMMAFLWMAYELGWWLGGVI